MAQAIGLGTTIASSTGTTMIQVTGISGPSVSGDSVETTNLGTADNFRTFIGGLIDSGDVTFDLQYDPGTPSHQELSTFLKARTVKSWTITLPSGLASQTEVFSGFVNGLSQEVVSDDLVTCAVTIKVTGDADYNTT